MPWPWKALEYSVSGQAMVTNVQAQLSLQAMMHRAMQWDSNLSAKAIASM